MSILCAALAVTGVGFADSTDPVSSSTTGPVTLQDIDDQIAITKEFIDRYKMRAYMFNQKAQSIMSRDFLGYRSAETLSEQSQSIVDDLIAHLHQLEKERAALVQRQAAQPKPAPQKS